MRYSLIAVVVGSLLAGFTTTAQAADAVSLTLGGDTYVAGQIVSAAMPVAHDVFLAGSNVTLTGAVSGDAHLAGFDVQSTAPVGGDVYAAGFSVTVAGSVAGDVTALGNSVVVRTTAPIPGNVRATGANVTLDTEVGGAALVTGDTVTVNGPIKGDFAFYGEHLTFGPAARIDGQVLIHAPKEIPVPASVASADRVVFSLLASPAYPREVGQTAEALVRGFWAALWAAVMWWLLLLVVGAALITLAGGLVGELKTLSSVRPFRRLGLGVLGFAAVVGLVPVIAMTVVGILLLPFVLIFVAAACSLAYLAGVYFAGLAIAERIMPIASNGRRIGVLAISLLLGGLLTMVPFLGWFITLGFVAFGFGVIAALVMANWSTGDRARLSAQAPASLSPGAVKIA